MHGQTQQSGPVRTEGCPIEPVPGNAGYRYRIILRGECGPLLVAIGADVLHMLTTYWIGHLVARKTNTYGAVGIALAVLLWVYILGRIIVGSAGLNATLRYRSENR